MNLIEWVLKFKEPRAEINKVGGYLYKCQVEYRYNKEKKQTDKISIGLLGEITENEALITSNKQLIIEQMKTRISDKKESQLQEFVMINSKQTRGIDHHFSEQDFQIDLHEYHFN